MPKSRLVLPLLAFAVGAVILAVAAALTLLPSPREPSVIGGPFALQGTNGRIVTEKDIDGAPHLVFFGFTHCPDICPAKLFEMSEVLRASGDKGRTLRAYFITVDPERDTLEVLKNYVGSFDDRIIGLTGDRAAIDGAIKAYRAYAKKVPLKDGDYTMEHTALVYLMDRNGRFVAPFNLDRPAEKAAADWMKLL